MKNKLLCILVFFTSLLAVNGQDTRDPWLWPFAQNSIWNMPIGSNAVYVNANIGPAGFAGVDKEYMYKIPAGSPVRNIYGPHTWNDRCPIEDTDKYQGQMRIPDNLLMPDATASETPNNVATFLQPTGGSLISLAPFTRCTEGGTVFGWKRPDLEIKGEGITGAHWGSGLSGFGGSIRKGELLGSAPIRHALKIDIWGQKYLYYASDRLGFRWPATNADGYAAETWGYMRQDPQISNPNKAMVQGSLLAIPPSVTEASLNLVTAPAKKLFKALQDFGAYIVDDAAWDAHYICAEDGVKEETEAQFGIGMHSSSGDFKDDINKLFQALKVVDNNAPDNIGGGGTPRTALAPPFQPDDTPPAIKIMPLGDSHTHGQNGAPSYRGPLRKLLMDNGYTNIDFVGPQYDESPGDYVPADGNHAGFAGFTIGPSNLGYSIKQSIDWIMQSDPDIILLEIGVNDNWNEEGHGTNYAATMPERYEALVQRILEIKPTVKILVATLLPVKWDLNWSNSGNNYNLNQKIESLPGTYSNVKFVDMFDKMLTVVNTVSDYNDDIHFNQTGYSKVANVWYESLTPLLLGTTPTTPSLPGKIEAESYNGMSGVQTESTTDTGGGSNVGYIDAGDWMDYNVNVTSSGTYSFKYRVAATSAGQLQLKEGTTVLHSVNIPATGGWQTWTTVSGSVNLTAGTHTLRIHVATSGWNFNWFEAALNQAPSASITAPANNASFAGPASITINATAADSDGTVSKVEFYQGSVKLGEDATSPYSYSWTNVAAGNYALTVKAYDNLNAATTSQAVNIAVTTTTCNGTGTGLSASYFNNMTLSGTAVLNRTDATVNFDWGTGSPASGVNTNSFSVRWTGQVQPCYTENYTFETETDDGIKLWVNNVLLIDKWVNQGATPWTGTISLSAGQKYDIKLEYYENDGGAVAKLRWSSASQAKVIIPSTQLYPVGVVPSGVNMGFEADAATQAPTGWSEWQNIGNSYTEIGSGSHGGTYHLTHWNSSAFEVSTFQTINNLPIGTYKLSAYVLSGGGQQYCQMGVYGHGGTDTYVNLPTTSNWSLIEIPGIEVTSGQLTIDFYTLGNAGNWSCYDDVLLTKTSTLKSGSLAAISELDVVERFTIKAFPVPFKDQLTVMFTGFDLPVITVYNMLGKVVLRQKSSATSTELYTGQLPSGSYIISVKDKANERKIMVTK